MREIKFQIWDNEKKRMITSETDLSELAREVGLLHWLDVDGIYVGMDGSLILADECGNLMYLDSKRFKPRFWTGLHDRNGREIYEGDILRDDEMGLNVVRWEDGSFWLEMFYEGGQSLMEHLSDYNEVCEVIGNIFENPELLEREGGGV